MNEYAEILLLDPQNGEILRAYPFPGVPPQSLQVTDDAIYCIRQGDGALGDSMLCRIDRSSLEATVRVFPSSLDSRFTQGGDWWAPAYWTIADPTGLALWQELDTAGDVITISGWSGTATVDPATLDLLLLLIDEAGR